MGIINNIKSAIYTRNMIDANTIRVFTDSGPGYYFRPDRLRLRPMSERSVITPIFNRIAMDVSGITINHVVLDDKNRFKKVLNSPLNRCLNLEANTDQNYRDFIQDVVMSMLDDGSVAVVPVEYDFDTDKKTVFSLRTAKILEWYPSKVKVNIYDERDATRKDIIVNKKDVAIIENPLYSVINEPNSTAQRLVRKLALNDSVDEMNGAGKIDLIVQLPYAIKSKAREADAERRRKELEDQLANSKYGIAYTDGTEKITQLNRSVDNNLLKQIEYHTALLYSQLGITSEILNGTADEKTNVNYINNTIEPIISAIVNEFRRKFLSARQIYNREDVLYFKNPFKLVPVSQLAEMSDKLTRNEIMSSNEVRQIIGLVPSSDPSADELRNKNLSMSAEAKENQNENKPADTNKKEEEANGNEQA